jgi:hypothetical protein
VIAFLRPTTPEHKDAPLAAARLAVAEALLAQVRESDPVRPAAWKCWSLVAWMAIVAATAWTVLLIG